VSVTAGQVMDGSAALLSDPSKVTFGYVFQLPFLVLAWDELQEKLVVNGIVDVDEETSSPALITAGTKQWDSQPNDLLFPVRIWEKAVGAPNEEYIQMDERRPTPDESQETELGVWYFAEGFIKFRGAISDRSIVLKYQRDLATVNSEATILPVKGVKSFLVFRTAALIAKSRGNQKRADDLTADAAEKLADLIGAKVKDEQGTPARPRRYGYSLRKG